MHTHRLERERNRDTGAVFRRGQHGGAVQIWSGSWDRVVCVITTGQAWQFITSGTSQYSLFIMVWSLDFFLDFFWDLILLCRSVKGIYVTWANDPPNAKIKDWNVSEPEVRLFILVFCVY
jgi:hypothetical protein